jgi:transposase InsO family protein
MNDADHPGSRQQRWAHLRFAVVGALLAAPPAPGELITALRVLADKRWRHPVSGKEVRFGVSTIERWFYRARRERQDPVSVLRRKLRSDVGRQTALNEKLAAVLLAQYREHPRWSVQLHSDNLAVRVLGNPDLGTAPSYASVRRFLRARGLRKRRGGVAASPGVQRAEQRLEEREVRPFEATHVNALWHLDFHHGSHPVLTAAGQWVTPLLLGVLDDRSRLCCHAQWYLAETAECLVHGLSQAIMKRGLPRALLTDNGSAMIAAETREGLARLGIVHHTTLPHSPYQNGKQENFWTQIEGRLMAMLEGVQDLPLALLNRCTQAWVELEYHRRPHGETGQPPLQRFLDGPDLTRPAPAPDELGRRFTASAVRTQRHSDGTLRVQSVRFEVPNRYRHLRRLPVRFTNWDRSTVYLVDARTDAILCRLYPVDLHANASGKRRALEPIDPTVPAPPAPSGEMAALLQQLLADYAATGLPAAYLPAAGETEDE